MALTPDEVRYIATLARVRDRPQPSDPRSAGCVASVVAVITLLIMPFIGPGFDLSGGAILGLGIVLVLGLAPLLSLVRRDGHSAVS